ncbi:MAG: hypothetical protein ABI690_22745 [Chloroflexota bacterium]
MPYADSWYIEKGVAIQRMYGNVTLEDAEAARNGLAKLLETGTTLVHVLVDVSEVERFPTNLFGIRRLTPNIDNPNLGWLIIYGAGNPLLRFIASTLAQLGMPGVRMRMFSRWDESLIFLQGQDSTLGNLKSFGDTA